MEEYKFYKSYYLYSKKHDIYVSNYGNVKDNDKIKLNPTKVLGERIYIVVAKLFVPNPDNKPQVDHIDTNRKNNVASNLRWVTNEENMHNQLTRQHCSEAAKKRHKDGVYDYTKMKGRIPWNKGIYGEGSPMYGKKHSEEAKAKMRTACIGRPSNMKGKKFSEEHNRKLSLSKMGKHRVWNDDTHTTYHYE